jgi:hypothetical protein
LVCRLPSVATRSNSHIRAQELLSVAREWNSSRTAPLDTRGGNVVLFLHLACSLCPPRLRSCLTCLPFSTPKPLQAPRAPLSHK